MNYNSKEICQNLGIKEIKDEIGKYVTYQITKIFTRY